MQPVTCDDFAVRVFWDTNPDNLDETINSWLQSEHARDLEVIDTSFQVPVVYSEKYAETKEPYTIYSLVLYLRKVKKTN